MNVTSGPNLRLVGFNIPYLPDTLAGSLHLTAEDPEAQLQEVLQRQANLVAGLHRWQGASFSLRYIFTPGQRDIEVGLLVRLSQRVSADHQTAGKFATQLQRYFGTHEVPLEPVTEPVSLRHLIAPFCYSSIAELRQRVQFISVKSIRDCKFTDFFTVFPFGNRSSSWIPVMRMLMAQQSPVMLSAFLQPTELLLNDEKSFSETASMAQGMVQQNFDGESMRASLSNPQAEIVSRTYSDYITRLQQPFLCVFQIASPDPDLCGPLAQAIGGEVSSSVRHSGLEIPSGFDVAIPSDAEQFEASKAVLETLSFSGGVWHPRIPPPAGKERLPYLCDARTAAATFRFPVSIRGGVPGIATRQHAPSQLGPQQAKRDAVFLGRVAGGGEEVAIDREYLKRHTLIAGINGSGKTTTCFQLLFELHRLGIPFLIIEPAKHEYRTLLASHLGEELRVFTLGDAGTSPFRLNPLEILPGVRVEGHISKILACLESALPTFGALPSLLEASLYRIYAERGWRSTDIGVAEEARPMPTLRDLYFAVIRATEERGYSDKTRDDIQAAAAGRIVSFLRGSKGRMLDVPRSTPMAEIMKGPTVLELDSLSDEEKALVMLFLITMLREHLATTRTAGHLQHVTLIEEAHRVMARAESSGNREVSADTSAGAVSLVSAALSEVRAYGEGIIIAEQVPGRLIEDALKNTNTKIIHRLPGSDDRAAVGDTMNLEEAQETYLTKLSPGQIAYFGEGLERPIFVEVNDVRHAGSLPERIADAEVERLMRDRAKPMEAEAALPYPGCRHCRAQCLHRDAAALIAFEVPVVKRFHEVYESCRSETGPDRLERVWKRFAEHARALALAHGDASNVADRAWCVLTHLLSKAPDRANAELFFKYVENPAQSLAVEKASKERRSGEDLVEKAKELIEGIIRFEAGEKRE